MEERRRHKDEAAVLHSAQERSAVRVAGLAEHWSRNGETIESCTLITIDPNELIAEIHDRMPAILPPEDYDLWLDPEFEDEEELLSLLRRYPADEMTAYPISTLVNSPKNDVPACIDASAWRSAPTIQLR